MRLPLIGLNKRKNADGLRVIKTARDERAINEAARAGFFPLLKRVVPSPEIRSKYAVYQREDTGEIEICVDYRAGYSESEGYKRVIDWSTYYPEKPERPFAAYLLPSDLATGERVFLEDLIEDLIGARWNQGDVYRLESAEAVWDGEDFVIDYDPKSSIATFIG